MGNCQGGSHNNSNIFTDSVPGSKSPGFSPIYRKVGTTNLTFQTETGINNLKDAYQHSAKQYHNRTALGFIEVKKQKTQDKEVQTRSLSTLTYGQLYNKAYSLGKYMQKHKMGFVQPIHKMKLVGIYAKNRYQWLIYDWASILFGYTTVPLYDTLGIQNLSFVLKQTQLTTIFVSSNTIKTLLKLKQHGSLLNVISFDKFDTELQKQIQTQKFKLFYYQNLISQGKSIQDVDNKHIKSLPEDCLSFCYTSGTTGPPKGALLSHKNSLAFLKGIKQHSALKFGPDDVHISYLPLPHAMQRFICTTLFMMGAQVMCSSGDITKLKDDCVVIRPTILVSVPRLYNKIVQGVKSKFAAQTGIKKYLIDSGVNSKLQTIHKSGEFTHAFYDKIVFSKVRQGFGGRVRLMASGSAPLTPQVHAFMKTIMCCPLIEGYGQTQSAAGVFYSTNSDTHHGQFAEIASTVQIKLADIPEMHYTSQDVNQNSLNSPRGQIWIRGPQVFLGYYKQEDVTKETITSDGWLKTGDVGQVMPGSNAFKIIDRKKNIFKLQQGEYIAPDKVEQIYLQNELISEVFLHGQSTHSFTVLIATPNKQRLLKYIEAKGWQGSYELICQNKELRLQILTQLNALGKKKGLNSLEQAKNIYLQPEGFANKQIMTNTMKLIRHSARKYYQQKINKMYQEGDILTAQKQ